MTSQITKIVEK